MSARIRTYLVGALAAVALSAACGQWSPPAPTAPSELLSNPASGATVSGTITNMSGSSMLASTASDAASVDLRVNVVGTDITAPVNVSGRFTLQGVPAGTILLRFTGPGIDVTLNVGGVGDRELLDVKLRLEVTSARIESFVRIRIDNTTEIEGEVTQVSGTCPNLSVVIHGMAVNLTTTTEGACGDIRVGIRIKIKGTRNGSVIVVIKVNVEGHSDDDDDDDDGHDDDDDD